MSLGLAQFRRDVFGKWIPPKPVSISLMANDVCNSKCEMCLIWKDRFEKGPSIDEFRHMFSDPLFANVRDIGVTGGEPTLRPDLEKIFETAIASLPRLTNASIITNGIQPDRVIERILAARDVCQEHDVSFSAMVSLDGVGAVHDKVRGKPGNFERALRVIRELRAAGVKLSLGSTITTTNAQHVDRTLEWAMEQELPIRFRVAEFIGRLYNEQQTEHIRNFDDLTRYNLGLFYSRLLEMYEPTEEVKKTYASVRGMLVDGAPRTTGCPYHSEGVIISAQRQLLYCSPKSPELGNIITGSATDVFFGNIQKRNEIRKTHCKDCIHDYHAPPLFTDRLVIHKEIRRRARTYSLDRLAASAKAVQQPISISDPAALDSDYVLIVGWYGTETIGDKAILYGIVDRLRRRKSPPSKIVLASFHPFVSRWTIKEMALDGVQVVHTYERSFEQAVEYADEIVVGGGPLMHIGSIDHMVYAFFHGSKHGAVTRIEGCGLGPLEGERYISAVSALVRLSSHNTWRDTASADACKNLFGRSASVVEDPARIFLDAALAAKPTPPDKRRVAAFYLREFPKEYVRKGATKDDIDSELLRYMATLYESHGLSLQLHAMCQIWEGGDDRIYNRRIQKRLVREYGIPEADIALDELPVAPSNILDSMRSASLNVCMRYHSVFFADILNVPYIAIDYTNGGKIAGFLTDRGKAEAAIPAESLTADSLCRATDALLNNLSF